LQAVQRYSKGAVALHWLIALALAGELALGFAMPKDASGFAEYQLHKSIGVLILALTFLRLGWRWTHGRPSPVESGPVRILTILVHRAFYVFMIGMPLTGWALVSSDPLNVPTILFGVLPLPHLPLGEAWNGLAHEAHEWLAWGGLALFALHVTGAIRHHLILQDDLLARMTFDGEGGRAIAAGGAVITVGLITLFTAGGDAAQDSEPLEQASPSQTAATVSEATPETPASTEDEVEATEQEAAQDSEDAVDEATETQPVPDVAEAAGPPPTWTIQPGGALRFSVENLGNALNGSFGNWSGDIVMDPDAPETASIAIRVDLASASLGDTTQDNMLRGAEFFDTASFPQAVWRSTSVRQVSGNRYEADGTLSLKGASRPQRISFTLNGTGTRRSVEGNASIDRNAFSVGTGSSASNLAGTVRVTFTFEATS